MKTRLSLLAISLCLTFAVDAKDIKTVVFKTNPEIHCANCENRIKSNIRFEKGVKDIKTDLKTKEVTIKYDAEKTNVENLIAGFEKIKYQATVVEKQTVKKEEADANSGATAK